MVISFPGRGAPKPGFIKSIKIKNIMINEIIYRSWNEFEKRFYYFRLGAYYSDMNCHNAISECKLFNWYNAEKRTGKTSKNKESVYEGDIISYLIEDKGSFEREENEVVVFDQCSWRALYPLYLAQSIEIVGNIHTNPELLNNKS